MLFPTSCGNSSHTSTCRPGTIWLTVKLPLWYVCSFHNVMSQILKWSSFIPMQWQTGHSQLLKHLNSPYTNYSVADLEYDGFVFLVLLPVDSSNQYRIHIPTFFLWSLRLTALSSLIYLLLMTPCCVGNMWKLWTLIVLSQSWPILFEKLI